MLHMKYHLQFWVPCCKKDAELLQDMQKGKKKNPLKDWKFMWSDWENWSCLAWKKRRDIIILYSYLKGGSSKKDSLYIQLAKHKEMASSYRREGLDWISGRICSQEWLGIGTNCSGKWSHHLQRYSINMQVFHLSTQFSDRQVERWMVELCDL